MRNVLNFVDGITMPEEVALAEQDKYINDLCDSILILSQTHGVIVSETATEQEKQIALARLKHVKVKDIVLELDAENYQSNFELAGTIIMFIIKTILKIGEMLFRFMLKVISFTAQAHREAGRLQAEILRSLHTYKDIAPQIFVNDHIASIVGQDLKVLTPYGISKLFEQDLSKYDPGIMLDRIDGGIIGIVSEMRLGTVNAKSNENFVKLGEELKDILTNLFGATPYSERNNTQFYYGLEGIPYTIHISFNGAQPPEVNLKRHEYKLPSHVEGYSPADAHVVVSAARKVFSRILDRDDGVAFQRKTKAIVAELKKDPLHTSEEVVNLVPAWVKFARNYIREVNNYEYRIAKGALEAVNYSKGRWSPVDDKA